MDPDPKNLRKTFSVCCGYAKEENEYTRVIHNAGLAVAIPE